jgi:type III pantothenate kinase
MLLAVDIGNSSIKFGVFESENLTTKFSIPTQRDYTLDEIAREVGDRLQLPIDAAIGCSVVPEVESAVTKFISDTFDFDFRFLRSTDNLGLTINFNVETTGTDRLVNSFAAAEKYGTPCIVVSFGTATTIDVVSRVREYLGGLIAPGMKVSAKALSIAASKLPEAKIFKPKNVIAQTTETAIQSGIVYGQIAMVEGLLKRVMSELGHDAKVVATGGFAELVATDVPSIIAVDNDLTLDGLRVIHQTR